MTASGSYARAATLAALPPEARFLLAAASFALSRPGFSGALSPRSALELAALAEAARRFERAEEPALREAALAVADMHESAGRMVPSRLIRLEHAVSVACRASAFDESAPGRSGSERTAGGRA